MLVTADVFALCFMIRSLYAIWKFKIPAIAEKGLDHSPENRALISNIKQSFQ